MLVTLNEVLPDAKAGKYAVGLFNTVNLEMAKGVVAAAEEMDSPVIIGTAEVLLPYASLEHLSSFLIPMAKNAKVPVVLHFDHGLTPELIVKAMDLGFTSVMYDCSTLPFEENSKRVAELVKAAHARGVSVEAELGHVGSADGNSAEKSEDNDTPVFTDPDEARIFYEKTWMAQYVYACDLVYFDGKFRIYFNARDKANPLSGRENIGFTEAVLSK